ncbi:hypothetical protein KPZU09_57970 [Klebsiella pneumoniae]|uniref:Uncharacterized protein n=1 Tax=Klebsiella pneumoniae TaxID=573 RepID=A0A919HWK7_KLEPN|nr:hypothetical protein KPZU09_57970 [Klebsiella pneumoniae]
MSFIRYRSLFTGQKAKYANSTQLMLAMPNAAGSRPLGICSRCSRALLACPPLCPQCGLPAAASRHPAAAACKSRLPGIGWWRSMTIARR